MKLFYLVSIILILCVSGYSITKSGTSKQTRVNTKKLITGADQPEEYLPYLKGKRVGILANQTTITGDKHLID